MIFGINFEEPKYDQLIQLTYHIYEIDFLELNHLKFQLQN